MNRSIDTTDVSDDKRRTGSVMANVTIKNALWFGLIDENEAAVLRSDTTHSENLLKIEELSNEYNLKFQRQERILREAISLENITEEERMDLRGIADPVLRREKIEELKIQNELAANAQKAIRQAIKEQILPRADAERIFNIPDLETRLIKALELLD